MLCQLGPEGGGPHPTIYIDLLCHHGGDGHYGWGRGRGGQYTAYLYHPCIMIHAYLIRGGSEESRATADPTSATLWRQSSWRLPLISRLSVLELRCNPSLRRSTKILVSMRRQVSGKFHGCRGALTPRWLGNPPRSSANRRLTPSGVFGCLMGKCVRFPR